jgi:hypothetical protein
VSVADAVVARLVAVFPVASGSVDGGGWVAGDIGVFDVAVPGVPPSRYVVVYCDTGARSASAVDGASRDQTYSIQVTSAASLPNATSSAAPQCRWLAEQVRDALTDWSPQVPGLQLGPLVHRTSRQPVVDESIVDRPLVFAVDQFTVHADRITY